MFYRLQRLQSVSLIFADSFVSPRIELAKLFDYVEQVPALAPEKVWKCIEDLRRDAVLKWDDIDPASEDARAEFATIAGTSRAAWRMIRGYDLPDLPTAVTLLVRTPRSLKFMLRRTLSAWDALHGEVDFDDLLLLSVLRELLIF